MHNPYIWHYMGYGYLVIVRNSELIERRTKHDEEEGTRGYWADTLVARDCFRDLLSMQTVGEA